MSIKKPLLSSVIVGLVVLAAITSYVLFSNRNLKEDERRIVDCNSKQFNWDQGSYDISNLNKNEKIIMKVEDRNEEYWHRDLQPIKEQEASFDTCEASIAKAAPDVLESPNIPAESRESLSHGLPISIGIESANQYQKITDITLRMHLSAKKDYDAEYNLDEALENLSQEFTLISSQGNMRLVIDSGVHTGNNFSYEIIEVNGEWTVGEESIAIPVEF